MYCPAFWPETVCGELTPGEAEKLARLVSEHHKAVHEIEERLRRMEEAVEAIR
jgi:hypothetical protein